MHLEIYKRGEDQMLFDLYYGLYGRQDGELKQLVKEALQRYPVRCEKPDIYMVLSHNKRMSINTKMNDYLASQHELAGKRILEFDWDEGELKGTNMQPQPMNIWKE